MSAGRRSTPGKLSTFQGTTMATTASRLPLLLVHLVLLMMLSTKSSAILTREQIEKLSADGEKLLDQEFKRGFRGLRILKAFADKNEEKHSGLRAEIERALAQKQGAAESARGVLALLEMRGQSCNKSLWLVWENECRPCLENACKQYLATACSGGGGGGGTPLHNVARFFENFNPFASVPGSEAEQLLNFTDTDTDDAGEKFSVMEQHFHNLSKEITRLFQRGTAALGSASPPLTDMLGQDLIRWFQSPLARAHSRPPHLNDWWNRSQSHRWLDQAPMPTLTEDQLFWSSPSSIREGPRPMPIMQDLLGRLLGIRREAATTGNDEEHPAGSSGGLGQAGDFFTCKRMERNSKGCLAMKDTCEPCKRLIRECPELHPLQRETASAFKVAEFRAGWYNRTADYATRHLHENTRLLERMKQRFGWVAQIADSLRNSSGNFSVEAVLNRDSLGEGSAEPETTVRVRLFDKEPISFSMPNSLAWDDPNFIRTVVEHALRHHETRGERVSIK